MDFYSALQGLKPLGILFLLVVVALAVTRYFISRVKTETYVFRNAGGHQVKLTLSKDCSYEERTTKVAKKMLETTPDTPTPADSGKER